jgi:two-component system NtrC family sensor kinase
MKKILFYLLLSVIAFSPDLFAQQDKIDSLDKVLMQNNLADSIRIKSLNKLATLSGRYDKKRAYSLYSQSITLARRSKNLYGEIRALVGLTKFQRRDRDFAASRESLVQALQLAHKSQRPDFVTDAINDLYQDYLAYPSGDKIQELEYALYYLKLAEQFGVQSIIADACTQTGYMFSILGDFSNAFKYHKRALKILEQNKYRFSLIRAHALLFLAETYKEQEDYNQAIQQHKQSFQLANQFKSLILAAENEGSLASIYQKQKRYNEAFNFAFRGLATYTYLKSDGGISYLSLILARIYVNTNKPDSALVLGKTTIQFAEKDGDLDLLKSGHEVLSKAYELKKDFKTAYYHNLIYQRYEDSLFNKSKAYQVAYLQYSTELSLKESKINLLEKDKVIRIGEARRQQLLLYAMLAGVTLVLVLMFVLIKNYRTKQRANNLLQKQKEEIQATLVELKSTQAQLIQSEKMASLGELTAGIAHEIQNPLNFVNNFSEVNKELIGELYEEQTKELRNFQIENEILNDIDQNLEKVIHHGKRADAIVKGMLQHSRVSTGQKELTDINALADEYLRLSYHGLRAKDKTFNATLQTDFDATIGKINIVPQDIGRVLLNLYNNAFYAVTEKKKQPGEDYEPTVSVSTKKTNGKVEIRVGDNGNGIPQKVLDKIFQPFFTTKPTGQGTGLGLSLSYDIIKAHGGEIKVETKEGEGAEFIIQLPLT